MVVLAKQAQLHLNPPPLMAFLTYPTRSTRSNLPLKQIIKQWKKYRQDEQLLNKTKFEANLCTEMMKWAAVERGEFDAAGARTMVWR